MSNIWIAASEGNLERVRELLDQGLSPNESDENGYTPCFAAASWHHAELLRFLVEDRGADVNMRDPDGDTPLFVVESVRMAQLLIELGADPTVKNDEGLTVCHPPPSAYRGLSRVNIGSRVTRGRPSRDCRVPDQPQRTRLDSNTGNGGDCGRSGSTVRHGD